MWNAVYQFIGSDEKNWYKKLISKRETTWLGNTVYVLIKSVLDILIIIILNKYTVIILTKHYYVSTVSIIVYNTAKLPSIIYFLIVSQLFSHKLTNYYQSLTQTVIVTIDYMVYCVCIGLYNTLQFKYYHSENSQIYVCVFVSYVSINNWLIATIILKRIYCCWFITQHTFLHLTVSIIARIVMTLKKIEKLNKGEGFVFMKCGFQGVCYWSLLNSFYEVY